MTSRDRASVDVTFAVDNTLYILRGQLWGDGTVLGNVSLSRQGATQWAGGEVRPGVSAEDGTWLGGTIDVTGNFTMWTGGCAVSFYVGTSGAAGKLAVAGTATLTGYVTVAWDPSYHPGLGTTVTFMTWGQRIGMFSTFYANWVEWTIDDVPVHVEYDFYSDVRGFVVTSD